MQLFRKRVREIGMRYGSLSGVLNSNKLKKTIQFESSLERDFIYLLEFDMEVKSYLEQPITLEYMGINGKKRRYTPDFYIQYKDSRKKDELIEIKYKNTLNKNHFKLKPKFDAARIFCEKNGLSFRTVTEVDIRPDDSFLLDNIIFLSKYRDVYINMENSGHGGNQNVENSFLLIDYIKVNGPMSIDSLLNQVGQSLENRGELLFELWYLISHKFIDCDLKQKLTMNSKVWVY